MIPAAVRARAEQTLRRFTTATGVAADAGQLLAGRAALLGWASRGRVSAGAPPDCWRRPTDGGR